MRLPTRTPRIVPAALLASMVLGFTGTAAWGTAAPSVAAPAPTSAFTTTATAADEPMLLGAGGGNLDRTNTGVGIDRWYGGSGDVDKAITRARANHAAGVRTWLSFKLPYGWSQMAAGTGDVWAKDLFTKLDALDFEVWVAFHHEPEGDGVSTDWRKMQDHLSRLVPGGITGDIKFWLIVTGWAQEFNPSDTANQWSTLYPTGAPIYGIAYDAPYLKYGYEWVNGVKTTTMDTGWTEASVYIDKLAARAKSYGVKAAIGEYGYSDEAFAKDKTWLDRMVASARADKLAAISYFDTQLNSKKSWYLGSATSAKRAYFDSVMAQKVPDPASPVTFVGATQTSANRTSHTVPVAAGTKVGDTMVLFFSANTTKPTYTYPAGWTAVGSTLTGTGIMGRALTKVATASDLGSTVRVTSSGYAKSDMALAVYRGADAATPVAVGAGALERTVTTAHTSPAVTTPAGNKRLVTFWADKSSTTTTWAKPAGQDVRSTAFGTGGGHMSGLLAESSADVTGSTGALTATANSSTGQAVSFSIVLQ